MKSFKKYYLSLIVLTFVGSILQGYKPIGPVATKYKTFADKNRLFKEVGCQYSNRLDIQYPKFSDIESEKYKQAQLAWQQYSKKYAQSVQKKHYAPMYLKWISNAIGYGIFANQFIKEGAFIGEYCGILRPVNNVHDNLDYAWYYTLDGPNNEKLVIDGKLYGNELRFINHHNDPNTMRIDVFGKDGVFHVCYIASKNIAKDEQLTVSYGDGYFTSRNLEPLVVS